MFTRIEYRPELEKLTAEELSKFEQLIFYCLGSDIGVIRPLDLNSILSQSDSESRLIMHIPKQVVENFASKSSFLEGEDLAELSDSGFIVSIWQLNGRPDYGLNTIKVWSLDLPKISYSASAKHFALCLTEAIKAPRTARIEAAKEEISFGTVLSVIRTCAQIIKEFFS